MEFENPRKMSREEIAQSFASKDANKICDALVSMAFYEENWKWSQDQCLLFLSHPNAQIRGLAAVCLGHIARTHRHLNRALVISSLKKLFNDEKIAGQVQDALDDIQVFLK